MSRHHQPEKDLHAERLVKHSEQLRLRMQKLAEECQAQSEHLRNLSEHCSALLDQNREIARNMGTIRGPETASEAADQEASQG